jgi:hypothetical protein
MQNNNQSSNANNPESSKDEFCEKVKISAEKFMSDPSKYAKKAMNRLRSLHEVRSPKVKDDKKSNNSFLQDSDGPPVVNETGTSPGHHATRVTEEMINKIGREI